MARRMARPSIASRVFFLWAWPVLKLGTELGSSLTTAKLPKLPFEISPEESLQRVMKHWEAEVEANAQSPSLVRGLWNSYGTARWLILFVFWMLTTNQSLFWITFSAVLVPSLPLAEPGGIRRASTGHEQ